MQATNKAIALIREFEGCNLQAYLCPANVWTIGYGHTKGVASKQVIDSDEAEKFLREDIAPVEQQLTLKFPGLPQCCFDALVCFSFNLGLGWTRSSGLATKLKEGKLVEAADELLRWNKAGGKVLSGLTRRRIAERELFLSNLRKAKT